MAQRGRGLLEVKDSNDPFYVTTSRMVEVSSAKSFDAPEVKRLMPKPDPVGMNIDWSFMYSRTSDDVGKGIPHSDSRQAKTMGQRSSLGERARKRSLGKRPIIVSSAANQPEFCGEFGTSKVVLPKEKAALDALLESFRHTPKSQNPLYSTTTADIGQKKPTAATFTFERHARQQAFSKSFNGIKYRDMGLSTSTPKSAVHHELDPQFM